MSMLDNKLLTAALLGIAITFLILLFYRGFNDPSEGRYAEVPREMVASGNWLEMRMLGYRYYEKTPLTYWLVAPAIKLFGAHDWAVRVPLLLNGLGLAILFWLLACRNWPRPLANGATLAMLCMIGVITGTSVLLTDAFLVLFFGLACVSLFYACQPEVSSKRRFILYMTAAICAVLGFLTKGAVAVVLPGAIIFIWLLWERRMATLRTWSILWAALLFVILLAPVLLLLEKHNPGFFHYFVIDEHVSRFTGTREIQLHTEPFWFFFQVLLLLMLPWTLFILRTVRQMVVNKFWHTDELSRFLVVWVVVVIGFFSASTGKLMSYIMPAIPPLGLLLGRWGIVEPLDGSRRDRILWNIGAAGLPIASLAIFIGWLTAYYQWLPKDVYPISGISVVALIPVGLALLLITATRLWQKTEGVLLWNAGILLTASLLLSPLAGKDFNVFLRFNSSHVYKKLSAILKPEDQVIVFWAYRPALPFYLQRLYVPYEDTNELLYGMQAEPQRARDLQGKAQLDAFMKRAPGRVFAVIGPHNIERKFKPLAQRTASVDIPHDPDTIVLEILPPILP